MGRARSRMEYIRNNRSRNTTFLNRKKGLINKADELSILCGIAVCMIIFWPKEGENPNDKMEIWPENQEKVNKIVNMFLKTSSDGHGRAKDVSDYFKDRHKDVEKQIAKLRKKNIEVRYPISDRIIESYTEDELRGILEKLDTKFDMVMKLANHHALQLEKMESSNAFDPYLNSSLNFLGGNMDIGILGQGSYYPSVDHDFNLSMNYLNAQSSLVIDNSYMNSLEALENTLEDNKCTQFGRAHTSGSNDMQYQLTNNPDLRWASSSNNMHYPLMENQDPRGASTWSNDNMQYHSLKNPNPSPFVRDNTLMLGRQIEPSMYMQQLAQNNVMYQVEDKKGKVIDFRNDPRWS